MAKPAGTFTILKSVVDGRVEPMLTVTCRCCGRRDQIRLAGKSPGWGGRIFRNRGWLLGRTGASRDLCPDCTRVARAEAPVRTPKARAMAYAIASGNIARPKLTVVPKEGAEGPMADALRPLAVEMTAQPNPPTPRKPQTKRLSGTGYATRTAARRGAYRFLKRLDVADPLPDRDFRVFPEPAGTYGFEPLERPSEPVPEAPETEQQKDPQLMSQPLPVAQPPRPPSMGDNRRILDALEEHYDTENQRYRASFTDATVAQKLDVPRAWVTKVREEFFGPEVNAAEIQARLARETRLNELVPKAEAALTRIMEQAAAMETLLNELKKLKE